MKTEDAKRRPPLEKGQTWKIEHGYVHIVDVGKRLVHYKMLRSLAQRAATTRLIGIGELAMYLRSNDAELTAPDRLPVRENPSELLAAQALTSAG